MFFAGDKALFDAAAGPLDVMGKAKFYLGEVGAGAKMKLVVNAIMGTMMAAFAEGLSLAEQVRSLLKSLVVTDILEDVWAECCNYACSNQTCRIEC